MARGLEAFLAVLMLGISSGPGAADPLLREFAVCAGRLSAVMEDQWMFDGPRGRSGPPKNWPLWSR